ncbi:MAG: 50S ribosomal protein L1, partial [Marinomonas sp.]
MAKLSKKQKTVAELDNDKIYSFDDAIKTLREFGSKKFDETIELAINLGVDPRHADQMVRGMISLPSGTGKDVKVAVFAKGDNADKATAAGADKVGAEDLMEDMQAGNLD